VTNKNHILITGGTGVIGENLTKHIAASGLIPHVVTRQKKLTNISSPSIIFHYLKNDDVIDEIFYSHPIKAVIHLATFYSHDLTSQSLNKILDCNLNFGIKLLNSMNNHGCRHLINTTSCAEFDENGNYNPNTVYAASKKAFRDVCVYYAKRQDMKVTHLVLYDNYAEFDTRQKLVSIMCQHLRSKAMLNLTPGDQHLNLVHISDTANAIGIALRQNLLDSFIPKNLYCVAPKSSITVRNLAKMLEEISGIKLNAAWGALPYRDNEIMNPWKGTILPNWEPKINLEIGLSRLLKSYSN